MRSIMAVGRTFRSAEPTEPREPAGATRRPFSRTRVLAELRPRSPMPAAPEAQQIAWLQEVEKTPFFSAMRRLTVLGLIALPKYGGNRDYLGWQLIGVEDNHAWEPPFGYYDIDYPGFEPYPGTKPYTA